MADSQAQMDEAAFDKLLQQEIEGVVGGPASLSGRGHKAPSDQADAVDDATPIFDRSLWQRLTHPRRLMAGTAFLLAGLATVTHMVTPAPPTLADHAELPWTDTDGPRLPTAPAIPATFVSGAIGTSTSPLGLISNIEPMQATFDACAVHVDAAPQVLATIALEIEAPCDALRRVEVTHGPLTVSIQTDETGRAQIEMPALAADLDFKIVVQDRPAITVAGDARDFDLVSRAVLHWHGDIGMELHAFEGPDADYGTDGHVSPDTPRNIARTLSGNGGFLRALGDPTLENPQLALIYTAPASQRSDLTVEAPVVLGNCGQSVSAGTIQAWGGTLQAPTDLTFTMPGCEAVGDLVLLGQLAWAAPVASN